MGSNYLIVGVHSDKIVADANGPGFPLLTLDERVYSLLSNRHVDAVVVDAPWLVTEEFAKHHKINLVTSGSNSEVRTSRVSVTSLKDETDDPYAIVKELGIYKSFESPCTLTTRGLCNRVAANKQKYSDRNAKHGGSEK